LILRVDYSGANRRWYYMY